MKFPDENKLPEHPYPELRGVLHTFASEISQGLKENLLGIYMVGSLAAGDFDADSDVDFLVVTKTGLSAANRQALQVIHTKMHAIDSYPAKHLEGSYISLQDLNDWGNVGKTELFYFDNGSTTPELSTHDNQWHVRWVLRERGIRLTGPGPETLLPVIPISGTQG